MKSLKLFALASVMVLGSSFSSAEQLHLPTSRDAFMHVQYTTAGEFAAGLKKHPKALQAMAKIFKVSQSEVLDYIKNNLHVDTLKSNMTVSIWGLTPKGHLYKSSHNFKTGMKVWATSDGTAVIRFVCSNPMVDSLPMGAKEVPAPEPPAKPVPEPPAPTPPPAMPEPPKPVEPPPKPVEPPPAPAPMPEPPKVEPQPAPTPAPAPAPQPKPMVHAAKQRAQISGWISEQRWRNHTLGKNTDIFGGGLSADMWNQQGWVAGPYLDSTGYFTSSTSNRPMRYVALGLQARRYFGANGGYMPYFGAGLGAYRLDVADDVNQRFTNLGGRALIGIQSSQKIFIEAVYNYLGQKRAARSLGTVGINLGVRF